MFRSLIFFFLLSVLLSCSTKESSNINEAIDVNCYCNNESDASDDTQSIRTELMGSEQVNELNTLERVNKSDLKIHPTNAKIAAIYWSDYRTSEIPNNAQNDILPDWLRVGEYSFQTIQEHLERFNPTIYISLEKEFDAREYFIPSSLVIDIPMSRENSVPVISPQSLLLYDYDFVEADSLKKQLNTYENLWKQAYKSMRPIIYEFKATLSGQNGRLQLEFHGDYLESVLFKPQKDEVARNIDAYNLPINSNIILGYSTLGDLITWEGFQGIVRMKAELEYNFEQGKSEKILRLSYQDSVLWRGLPLNIHYTLIPPGDGSIYTTLEEAIIEQITIFNFDDYRVEESLIEYLAQNFPRKDEDEEWMLALYKSYFRRNDDGQLLWPTTDTLVDEANLSAPQGYHAVNGYVIYTSGCCATYNHISVVAKEKFKYPSSIFQ